MIVKRYALLLGLAVGGAACSGGAKTETPAAKKSTGGDEADDDEDDGKGKTTKKPKPQNEESLSTDTETGTATDTGTDTDTQTDGAVPENTEQPAKDPPKLVTVYRFFKVGLEHFYTLDMGEGTNAGYTLETVGFKVLETAIDNAIPIYRCNNGSRHFVSIDPACEGKTGEGRYGYVMNGPHANTKELVRCHSAAATDFLATTPAECAAAGFITEGPLGYAPEDGFVP